jgi:GGDEF domain-containing protein
MELDLFYDLRNDKQGNDKIGLAAKDMVTKKLKKVKLSKIG